MNIYDEVTMRTFGSTPTLNVGVPMPVPAIQATPSIEVDESPNNFLNWLLAGLFAAAAIVGFIKFYGKYKRKKELDEKRALGIL